MKIMADYQLMVYILRFPVMVVIESFQITGFADDALTQYNNSIDEDIFNGSIGVFLTQTRYLAIYTAPGEMKH